MPQRKMTAMMCFSEGPKVLYLDAFTVRRLAGIDLRLALLGRSLARIYGPAAEEPLPDGLQRLIARLDTRSSEAVA